MPNQCEVCGHDKRKLVAFFLSTVCNRCAKTLKKVGRGEMSCSPQILKFYIGLQAILIRKDSCPPLEIIEQLSVRQLNSLAQWLVKVSRSSLT